MSFVQYQYDRMKHLWLILTNCYKLLFLNSDGRSSHILDHTLIVAGQDSNRKYVSIVQSQVSLFLNNSKCTEDIIVIII